MADRELRGDDEKDDGANAGCALRRSVLNDEIVQGTVRLDRSESGWPIVDISQLHGTSI